MVYLLLLGTKMIILVRFVKTDTIYLNVIRCNFKLKINKNICLINIEKIYNTLASLVKNEGL